MTTAVLENYLRNGYYNDKGFLRKEVFVDDAQWIAKKLAIDDKIKPTNLRKFYNHLKRIERLFRLQGNFSMIESKLYAFQRDAAYAKRRDVAGQLFVDFIEKNIQLAVQNEKNFAGFIEHFQSVIAYFDTNENSGHHPRGNQSKRRNHR